VELRLVDSVIVSNALSPIDSLISSISESALWSINIENLNTGESVFKLNSEKSLIPASGAKLFTSASALRFLGGDYRFETKLLTDGEIDNDSVMQGNLYIVGGGDPTFNRDFPPEDSSAKTVFEHWANTLKTLGVRTIAGDAICVDTFFVTPKLEPTWEYGDLKERFTALPGALSFNMNYIESGSISPEDSLRFRWNPTLFFAYSLQKEYPQNGIKILGQVRPFNPISDTMKVDDLDTLLLDYSPPLREIVKKININSINFYAEQVMRALGRHLYGEGSIEAGLKAVDSLLSETGIDSNLVRLVDGCGLSRHNWVSAGAITELLKYCRRADFAEDFCNSLAQYGQGTLRNRKPLNDNLQVFAKTGSMEGVRSFSGYLLIDDAGYVFSIICNNYICSWREVERAMDQMLVFISERR
jgi:D-alanyl-D-alanine carboxypeptidase/D-alanyl-D-alanine-endopeptidase (penicillin-binding protein 4)